MAKLAVLVLLLSGNLAFAGSHMISLQCSGITTKGEAFALSQCVRELTSESGSDRYANDCADFSPGMVTTTLTLSGQNVAMVPPTELYITNFKSSGLNIGVRSINNRSQSVLEIEYASTGERSEWNSFKFRPQALPLRFVMSTDFKCEMVGATP